MATRKKIKTLEEVRKEYILKVLKEADWDYVKASRILKVSEESLRKEIRKIFLDQTAEEGKAPGGRAL
jgi:hypothetical protein